MLGVQLALFQCIISKTTDLLGTEIASVETLNIVTWPGSKFVEQPLDPNTPTIRAHWVPDRTRIGGRGMCSLSGVVTPHQSGGVPGGSAYRLKKTRERVTYPRWQSFAATDFILTGNKDNDIPCIK